MKNKNPELINRDDILAEIEKVYNGRYDRSYDQAVHDLYNAIVKRIRRAPNCAEKSKKAEEKCKYLTDDGLCMGQKEMPVCSPCGPYCPLRRESNG